MVKLALWMGLLAPAMVGCLSSSTNTPGPTVDGGPTTSPDGGAPVVIRCDPPKSGPTLHEGSRIAKDETWTAAGSPHIIKGTVGIGQGATVTIEPCAQVRLQAAAEILVSGPASPNTASLVAEGDAEHPITFVRDDPAKPWTSLAVRAGGTMKLAYVTLEGGAAGNGPYLDAILRITGDQYKPPQEMVKVNHVTIKGSINYGAYLDGHGTFTADSTDLTVTGSKTYPVVVWASSLGNLPNGTFSGNGTDEIVVRGGGGYEDVATDTTMKNLGVPYHVGTPQTNYPQLRVASGNVASVPTLTIEAGTVIKFQKAGIFEIEHFTGTSPATGALVAAGAPGKEIVLTSAEANPAAGDWVGLWFGQTPSAKNKVDNVRVEYAGGTTGAQGFSCNAPGRDEAAIIILGVPSGSFVTNTTIKASARHGIDRGWRGGEVDFLATNTFDAVAACKQTFPKDNNGGCPANPACP